MSCEKQEEYSGEEIARRRDELAKQMLNTPPRPLKPQSEMKVGKRKPKVSQKRPNERPASSHKGASGTKK
jgi:hypothetical protein